MAARRVLVTGARAAAALDLARDFDAAGWEVHLADSRHVRTARWSRVPARHHRYPAPRAQGSAFRQRIAELVERHGIELVVPVCEEVFHLAAPSLHRTLNDRLFAPDIATLRTLHDKLSFAHACRQWGLPVPESHPIDGTDALGRFAAISHEWVFKPRFSRFGDRALVAPEPRALHRIEPTQQIGWMAQRYVRGEEACFHAIAHRGRLVAFAAYRSDWRLGGGASYAFEPLPQKRSGTLRAIADAIANQTELHGQFACDVIFDELGAPFLLECNPRATSGVHLLAGDGDLARSIGDAIAMPDRPHRMAYLAPAMWLFGLPRSFRGAQFASWRTVLAEGHDAISRPGDRVPIAGALADAAGFFLTGLRHNVSTNEATTFDIEWNGEDMDR